MTQSIKERLISAQLEHIIAQLQSADIINQEVDALVKTLSEQPISKLIALEPIQAIAKKYILDHPIHAHLLQQVISQINFALQHPLNDDVKLQQLIPDATVENIANYLSTQKEHREALIHRIFSNPTYAKMLSQTISHAINDYMENNVITKKMPGVGGLMKFGKNVIERATDSNLDDALQNYLSKNINNIIAMSENMANKHLDDQQVHRLITQGWKKIRQQPVADIQRFINAENIDEAATVVQQTWEHVRHSDYMAAQINDGIAHWYTSQQDTPLATLMADINVDSAAIQQEIKLIVMPIIHHLMHSGYLAARIEPLLRDFYESDAVNDILAS